MTLFPPSLAIVWRCVTTMVKASSDNSDEVALLEDIRPVEEKGWRFVADIFGTEMPDDIPLFTDASARVIASLGSQSFTVPETAFLLLFEAQVMF